MTPPYRPGDVVRHGPTEEDWVVAYADPESGRLSWCGWPEGEALIADCTLVRRVPAGESDALRAILITKGGQRGAKVARLYPTPSPVPSSALPQVVSPCA